MSTKVYGSLEIGKECYLRVMDQVVVVEVLGLAKDTIWVSFPVPDLPPEGTGVELEVHEEAGFKCYHTRVAASPSSSATGLMLERAESATYMKHRRDWRVPTDIAIWLKHVKSGQQYEALMCDLSEQGALVEASAPLEAGDQVILLIQLPKQSRHRYGGRIVYSQTTPGRGPNRFGVNFGEVSASARNDLIEYLWRQIRKLYPAELRALYPRAISRPAKKRRK